jgi:YidC/Oxa1 family membrane protein insertase
MKFFLALVAIGAANSFSLGPAAPRRMQLRAVAEHVDLAVNLHTALQSAGDLVHHTGSHDLWGGMDASLAHSHTKDFMQSLNLADGGVVATPEQYGAKAVDKTGVIGFIATYIEQAIDLFHNTLPGKETYGFSIIIFTCLIKALTLPLTKTQLESTTRMQKLTPLQEKIKAAYPREQDEQMRNQMISQLFQTANVNPLAGCLPALAQIPIFISLYRALQNLVAENKLDEGFLWIPDLEGPTYNAAPGQTFDWIKTAIEGSPILGQHDTLAFLTIPLILFISQTISMKVLQPPQDPNKVLTDQEQFSKSLTNNLPFIVAFFSVNVPAGLALYWIVNNVLTTVITSVVKNSLKDEVLPAEVDRMMAGIGGGAVGGGGSNSGGLSASKRAMQQVRESTNKKKKSFDPAVIAEVQTEEAKEAVAAATAAAAEAVVAPTEDEANDPDAPKGPIGKLLKTVNDRAVDATKEDADRFAEASAAAAVNAEDAVDSQAAPMYRASEGESKRKKRTKPAQKGGKKKKKKAA